MLTKKNYLLAALSALLLLFSVTIQAQDQPTPERREDQRIETIEKIISELNLTEEQATSVREIEEKTRLQAKELRNQDLTPEEKRTRLQEIRKNMDNRLKETIGEKNFKRYQELRKEERMNRAPRGERLNRPERPERPERDSDEREGGRN